MSDAVSAVADESDAHLIAQVRAGNTDAYGRLFDRHRQAAQRLAGSLVYGPDADDLVAEAFTRLLVLLQDGKGPDEAFRAYLLTAIRRLHVDRIRATTRTRPTDDDTTFDRGIDFVDPATTSFENQAAASAFASLPERWQLVLWHLEVEGQKPADIAPLLGMSANSVSALAYRAREGLRQAYLQGHLAENVDAGCRAVTPLLGGYVRRGLSARDTTKVEEHLDTCRRCAGIYLELAEVNSNLGALLAPALLGAAASAYLSGAGAAAAAAGSGAAAAGAASGGAASGGAASGGVASGGAASAGGAASSAAASGSAVSGAASGITAVGSAGTVGSAAVVGTLAQTAALPIKALAATVGAHSAVTAATVVAAGVATTAGVVVVKHDAGQAPDVVATAPSSSGPAATPAPTPNVTTAAPEPSATATVAPEPTPTPVVTTPSEPEASSAPEESAAPTPEPTATTPPPPPVPVTTDYSAGKPVISSDDTLGQRRVVVPFTVATTGELPSTTDVSVRVDFARTVVFRGIPGGGWTCTAERGQAIRTLTCNASVPSGASFDFPFKAIGLLPKGSVTISTAADPDPSDDSAMFASGLWLLGS